MTERATVPAVLGMSLLGATQVVSERGLTVGVTLTDSDLHAAGLVIGQLPPAGSVIRQGCQVLLTVACARSR